MANHTVTSNQVQLRGLRYLLAEWNADLAKQTPAQTPWTDDQLFAELCKPLLESLRTQGVETGGKAMRAALNKALDEGDTVRLVDVKRALGL